MCIRDRPLIEPGDDLASLIIKAINEESILIDDGDVFAIAQKIVSKSENRYLDLSSVNPSKEATDLSKKISKEPNFIQAILNESKKVVKFRMGVLIVEHKLGFIHANAGIDRSNIDQQKDTVLLLPKSPDKSAKYLSESLSQHFNKEISGQSFNFGPPSNFNYQVIDIVNKLSTKWAESSWIINQKENNFLMCIFQLVYLNALYIITHHALINKRLTS